MDVRLAVRVGLVMAVAGGGCGGAAAGGGGSVASKRPSLAFLAVELDRTLIPLACWDGAAGAIARTGACMSLVPDKAAVALSIGARASITGRDETTCEAAGTSSPIFHFTGANPGDDVGFAVWPPDRIDSVRIVPPPRDDDPVVKVSDADRGRLIAAIGQGSDAQIFVRQEVEVDLDGDGRPDRLWSVIVPGGEDSEGEYGFSGLVVSWGASPARLTVLTRSTFERFRVLGTLDLDGDGRHEIFVHAPYYEGHSMSVMHYTADGALESIGSWECGA